MTNEAEIKPIQFNHKPDEMAICKQQVLTTHKNTVKLG